MMKNNKYFGMALYAVLFALTMIIGDTLHYGVIDYDYAIEAAGTMVWVSIPIFAAVWCAEKLIVLIKNYKVVCEKEEES